MSSKNGKTNIDLKEAITCPKSTIDSKKAMAIATAYDSYGNEFTILDDSKACALKIRDNVRTSYKIKVERGGHFFNPLKVGERYNLTKRDHTTNDAMFKYRTVNARCFGLYIRFLKTKQDSLLIEAEREF